MDVILVVAGCAVVQSLFGIGLLVFGTPSLLLRGYSFADTLAILLPASITVSLLQSWGAGGQGRAFVRPFAAWCILPLVVTLAAVLTLHLHASLDLAVALLLAAFVALRMSPTLKARATALVSGHQRPWLSLIGVVHGLSNLGGGLLVILATARHDRKEDIRALVAFCYACFAAAQLVTLAILTPQVFGWSQLGFAALAGSVFVVVGQRVFRRVPAPAFDWLLTLFAAAYAGLLGLRAAGAL